jgi:hypothetical protein
MTYILEDEPTGNTASTLPSGAEAASIGAVKNAGFFSSQTAM